MELIVEGLGAASLAAWLYLALLHGGFRGGFWRAGERLDLTAPQPGVRPGVVAVVPARNEADVIGRTVAALLAQDYPGDLHVVVVDDHSSDGTADAAREAAADARMVVVAGAPLPEGWTGKLWAVNQGIERAAALAADAEFIWLSDADIVHHRGTLGGLVARAETEGRDLVSLMARLHCESGWERLLIPAFVFFFRKLYPFPWVNDPARRTAAAAGGCMLLRRAALERIGGFASIRGALIDDCALARAVKMEGSIWLGLAATTRSIRPYGGLGDIWDMVARSAYTQLRRSPLLLAGTVAGMLLIYAAPPVVMLAGLATGDGVSLLLGLAAWTVMAITYAPSLAFYGRPRWDAVRLPAAALLYTLMTIDSARRHWLGHGGRWKGRTHGLPGGPLRGAPGDAQKNGPDKPAHKSGECREDTFNKV